MEDGDRAGAGRYTGAPSESRRGLPHARVLLSTAVATRVVAVLLSDPGFPNGWGGEMPAVASSLAHGLGFASPYLANTGPTALVPPVYPVFLAGLFRLFGYTPLSGEIALGVNIVLSALTVVPLYVLARELFGPRCGLVAAWIWCLHPLAGYTDAVFVWNTALFALLLTTHLAMTVRLRPDSPRRRWVAYGALTGLLILTDPSALTEIGVAVLWLLYRRVRPGPLVLALAIAAAASSAWLVRNYVAFGQFVFLRSGLGLELSVGVRNDELKGGPASSLPNRDPAELALYESMGELRYFETRKTEAVQWIRAHPGDYARRTVARVLAFWTGHHLVSRIYFFRAFYGRFLLLKMLLFSLPAIGAAMALVGMVRIRHRAAWLCAGVLLCFPVVYYLVHVLPRYRLPLEPLLLCLTAAALTGTTRWAAPGAMPSS
jgi:4-amino-4-deoxy-L-arabinose transferase-like glycosyltransferase